jgi:hypothetical protein
LLALWAAIHVAVMLCYRDLHILGFWLYGNFHYFKVVQPVLLLFAIAVPQGLLDRSLRWREVGIGMAVMASVMCWRAQLVPGDAVASATRGAVGDLSAVSDAAIIEAGGRWSALYSGAHVLSIGGVDFHHNLDFKLYPRQGDVLLVPLRKLPAGDAVLSPAPGVMVGRAVSARQVLVFGLPCVFGLAGARCGTVGAPLVP